MEIGAYLRGLLRRWPVVLVVAVLAAGSTALVMRGTKNSYRAEVELTVPAAQGVTAGGNQQYVENFTVGLTTPTVLGSVARSTGVPSDELASGLAATQLGNSGFVSVTYAGPDPARAAKVARAAAQATAQLLAAPAVQGAGAVDRFAERALRSAEGTQAAAQNAVTAYLSANNNSDPTVSYRTAQASLGQLIASRQKAAARGDSVAGYVAQINQARVTVASLLPKVRAYNGLVSALGQAKLSTQDAQSRAADAAGDLAAARTVPVVGAAATTRTSASTIVARAVLVAGGLGLVLGAALVLLLEALRGTSRSSHASAPAADPTADPTPDVAAAATVSAAVGAARAVPEAATVQGPLRLDPPTGFESTPAEAEAPSTPPPSVPPGDGVRTDYRLPTSTPAAR